jgi:hypothetical protein
MKFFAALSKSFEKTVLIILRDRLPASITRVDLFVHLVVFPNKMQNFAEWNFVLNVFCGLI